MYLTITWGLVVTQHPWTNPKVGLINDWPITGFRDAWCENTLSVLGKPTGKGGGVCAWEIYRICNVNFLSFYLLLKLWFDLSVKHELHRPSARRILGYRCQRLSTVVNMQTYPLFLLCVCWGGGGGGGGGGMGEWIVHLPRTIKCVRRFAQYLRLSKYISPSCEHASFISLVC